MNLLCIRAVICCRFLCYFSSFFALRLSFFRRFGRSVGQSQISFVEAFLVVRTCFALPFGALDSVNIKTNVSSGFSKCHFVALSEKLARSSRFNSFNCLSAINCFFHLASLRPLQRESVKVREAKQQSD